MAIDLTVQYPGKIGAASPAYPYGEPRNVTTPSDGTGTPWEAAIVKETEGFKQALLSAAGITPSGTPDAVGVSQYLQALVEQVAGRAITYDASGTPDAIVLTQRANQEPIQSIFDGQVLEFIAVGTNTTAVTVNPATLGVTPVVNISGGALTGGEIQNGQRYKIQYDSVLASYVLLSGAGLFRGALVEKNANQGITNNTSTVLTFEQESYDTDNIHDNVTNNSRLTVPSGVKRVRLSTCVQWDGNSTGTRSIIINKNGGAFHSGQAKYTNNATVTPSQNQNQTVVGPVIDVVGGDYFEVSVFQSSGITLPVLDSGSFVATWFAMEIIE